MQKPYFIDLQKIGEPEIGYISVAQSNEHIPFDIKRVYWIYDTPSLVERGNHAHKNSVQLLIAVHGVVKISLESKEGIIQEYSLDNPNKGLFVPTLYWRKIHFIDKAVLLALSSSDFDEEDYIREYEDFKKY